MTAPDVEDLQDQPAPGQAEGQQQEPTGAAPAQDDTADNEEKRSGLPLAHLLIGGLSVLTAGGALLWQVFGMAAVVGCGLISAGAVVLYRGRKDKDGKASWTRTRQTSSRTGSGPSSFGRSGKKGGGLGGVLGGGRSGKGRASRLGSPGLGGKGRSGKAGGFGLGSLGKRGGGSGRLFGGGKGGGRSGGLGGGAGRRAAQRVMGTRAGQRAAGAGRRAGAAARSSRAGQRMAAAAKAARKAATAPSTGTKTSGNKTSPRKAGGKVGRWNTARKAAAKSLTKSRHPVVRLSAQVLGGLIAALTMWHSHRQAKVQPQDTGGEQPCRECHLCGKFLAEGEGETLQAIPAREGLVPLCDICAFDKALKRCDWCKAMVHRYALRPIEVRADPERICATCHDNYWRDQTRNTYTPFTATTWRNSMSGFPLATIAAEMNTAATRHTPLDMWQVARELDQLREVPINVALAIRSYTAHLQSEYPISQAVTEQIFDLYKGLAQLTGLAEQIAATFRQVHKDDLVREEAPRTNEKAWNVR